MEGEEKAPKCTKEMVNNCQFQVWYPKFKEVTFKAMIYELPIEFKEYLMEDGVMMPSSYFKKQFDDDSKSDKEDSEEEDSDIQQKEPKYNFSELETWIQEVISQFDEKVFVKLNWSAPRDSNWMVPNLNCSTVKEVLLLLKSSIFIQHDISCPYEGCIDKSDDSCPENLVMVLKRYHQNVRRHRDNEFRCFVRENVLIAVSQRDTQMFYEELVENLDKFKPLIADFYDEEIANKFLDKDFVFDIYIDVPPNNKVWLIDFNPWMIKTDPCLFEWNQNNKEYFDNYLLKILGMPEISSHDNIEWRILTDNIPIKSNEMTQYQVPSELVTDSNSEELKKFFSDMKEGNISKDFFQ